MASLASLIISCRTLAGDGSSDNFMRGENLNSTENGNPVDGNNTIFSTANFPVVPGGFISVRVDNQSVVPTSIAEAIGQLTVPVAPINSIYASYYYYMFSDAVWTEFVIGALQQCGVSTGIPVNDVAALPDNLLAVIKQFANYYFAMRIAEQTGLWYNQHLQERIEDRDSISKKWLAIAESKMKSAIAMRTSYYTGLGADAAPSFRVGGWQPREWTPSR